MYKKPAVIYYYYLLANIIMSSYIGRLTVSKCNENTDNSQVFTRLASYLTLTAIHQPSGAKFDTPKDCMSLLFTLASTPNLSCWCAGNVVYFVMQAFAVSSDGCETLQLEDSFYSIRSGNEVVITPDRKPIRLQCM